MTHGASHLLLLLPLLSLFCPGESTASSSGSPAKSSLLSDGSLHSSGGGSSGSSSSVTGPAAAPEQVLTQQPCSVKGSLSSDNIYAGLQGDGVAPHAGPGQGTPCTHPQP